jgi:hypothetical protein
MKGKFRKRSESVWCPKPKTLDKISYRTTRSYRNKISLMTLGEVLDFNKKLPEQLTLKATGWESMDRCEVCEYLEEFDLDNNGLFCLYPKLKTSEK